MIRVAICDDNPVDNARLQSLLAGECTDCTVSVYTDAESLLWDFETGQTVFDLIFLDIYLGGIDGVEAARRIRGAGSEALIVFVSTSEDFYREAYDLFAFNYLVKPISKEDFSRVLARAAAQLGAEQDRRVRFSFRSHVYNVRYSDILYIASNAHMISFHLKNGETLECYGKLDDIAAQLSADVFVRCHQSYFVNLYNVTSLEPGGFLFGKTLVPISRTYSQSARTRYRNFLFSGFE